MITIEEILDNYVIKKSFKVINEENENISYNMYEIELIYKNGKKEIVRVFADADSIDINSADENIKKWFLIDYLFDEKGFRKEQGTKDFIYVGRLTKNTFGNDVAERDYPVPEFESAKNQFEYCLKYIKQALGIEEKNVSVQNIKGKNYTISDIHGMYGSYMEVISKIKPQDNLYILGDVIDRGDNGIKILQDIIKRKKEPEKNPNINFMVGNHEIMFMENVTMLSSYINNFKKQNSIEIDIDEKEIVQTLSENLKLNKLISDLKMEIYEAKTSNAATIELDKLYELLTKFLKEKIESDKKYNELVKPLNIHSVYIAKLKNWIVHNKGERTLLDFYSLDKDERNEIFKFLYESNVILPQKIGEQNILFVHAMPPNNVELVKNICEQRKGLTVEELWNNHHSIMKFMVEQRVDNYDSELSNGTYYLGLNSGYLTICGHDPTLGKIENNLEEGYIRIDAACGQKKENSRLALYCIDDGNVRYIREMQDISKKSDLDDDNRER